MRGREATLLSEPGFDLGICSEKKNKIEEQKTEGREATFLSDSVFNPGTCETCGFL